MVAPLPPDFAAAQREVDAARAELFAALERLASADAAAHTRFAPVARDATAHLNMAPDGSGLRRAAQRMRELAASIRLATSPKEVA